VTTIRDDIVHNNPKLGPDPTLLDRLAKAYGDAKRMGFLQDKALVEFLYIEADAPGFYRQPAIAAWLTKPGQSVEDRFEDVIAVARRKLLDRQQENR
jgi:hypothetical protein